jgi:hypothetical protein
VRGRRSEHGYTLAIIDQGVGMNEEQLETANRRLAGRESFTVAPSRYLGHYVAGHLAATHGIEIRLTSTAAGGVTARIDVPNSVLVDGPAGLSNLPVEVHEHVDLGDDLGEAPGTDEPILEDLRPERPPLAPVPEPVEPVTAAEPDEPFVPDEPTPVAPVAKAPVAEAPKAPPLGGAGRLASRSARADRSEAPPAPQPPQQPAPTAPPVLQTVGSAPATNGTSGGLTRRVRGANAPKATNVAAAFGGGGAATPAKPASSASADDVASFLAAFSGGVERGLAESHNEHEEEQ